MQLSRDGWYALEKTAVPFSGLRRANREEVAGRVLDGAKVSCISTV
jgi:hypothetical protein